MNYSRAKAFPSGAKGIRLFAPAVLLVLLSAVTVLSQGQPPLPAADDAKPLLRNAAMIANLTGPGMASFHIRMKTKSFGERNKSIDGAYELWLTSVSSWREDVSWADAKFSRIVDGDRQWVAGDDTHRLDTDRLREITTISGFLNSISTKQVVRTRAKEVAGGPGVCVDLKQPPPSFVVSHEFVGYAGQGIDFTVNITFPDMTVCLNLATGLASEIDSEDYRWEFAAYAAFGEKQFPRELRKAKGKNSLVTAQVDLLEALDATQTGIFVPPADSTPQMWCPTASLPEPVRFAGDTNANHLTILPSGNSVMLPNGMGHLAFLYFTVSETGTVTDVRAYSLGHENPIKPSEKKILLQTQFRPAACHGKLVPGEYTLHLPEDRQAWP